MPAPSTSNGSSRPPISQASNNPGSEITKASVNTRIEEAKKLIPVNDREMTEGGPFPSLLKTAFQSGMSQDGQATEKVSLKHTGAGWAYSMTRETYEELRGEADLYKSPESPFKPHSPNAPNPFVGKQAPPWSMPGGPKWS